jgi:hypothetical protein
MPDALADVARVLPSYSVVQVGEHVTGASTLSASAVGVLGAWTVGAVALATLAWRRVVVR